jgi:hypothetical protein
VNLVITLSEADAERIGVPRNLSVDIDKLMARELIAMERVTGWSYEALAFSLEGRPAKNALGQPIFETDDDGTLKKDPAGNPIQVMGFNLEALLVVVWLAVRRAKGEDVAWELIDLDINATEFGGDEGKAPSRADRRAASRNGSSTTKSRSGTSSASRRTSSAT